MENSTPPVRDEREGLLVFLAQQRGWIRAAAFGLDEEQARKMPTASSLSVGGLVKHLARAEEHWIGLALGLPEAGGHGFEDHLASFRLGPDETLVGALAHYEEVAAATEAAVASIDDLDREVPVPPSMFWIPAQVKSWSVRWVLLHLIEETARHAGHADILRESIDGAQSLSLGAAAEGWPETEWLRAWHPAA